MTYYMARSFDQNGYYYETRVLLAIAALAVALWMWRAKGDRRFLIVFLSGVLFQGIMEALISAAGLRGVGYTLKLFGHGIPDPYAFMLQGLVEGGPLAVMAFWFGKLVTERQSKQHWTPYLIALALVVLLGSVVAIAAAGQPYSSVRPIFRWDWLWFALLAGSILLTLAVRGFAGLRYLALIATGVIVYLVATYEPMQVTGARLIVDKVGGIPGPSALWAQLWVMAYSHVVEVTGSKLHYFAIPLALGLLKPPATRTSEEPA